MLIIFISMLRDNVPSWELHLFKKWLAFSSPMGYLHFYFGIDAKSQIDSMMFSSPMGYLYFYSYRDYVLDENGNRSRPLWGIYISIQLKSQLLRLDER